MRGRAATAWFEMPRAVAAAMLSPDLWPAGSGPLRSRMRFYDLSHAPTEARADRPLDTVTGRFREGVVAVPVAACGVQGETSLFMWTDSEEYLIWGREAFGWPIRMAAFDYGGDLWLDVPHVGSTGFSRAETPWGTAALEDVTLSEPVSTGTPSGHWLTPRRILQHGPQLSESRELLDVQPVVSDAGVTFAGTGRVELRFRPPHPLAGLATAEAEVHVADAFEVIVGARTSVIRPAGLP
jgi:hypothetical protein